MSSAILDKVSEIKPKPRRRRADADRSRQAVLGAAIDLLDRQPDASVEAIAAAAQVTRQTVYAHFPSRGVLVDAVLDELTTQVIAEMDAIDLDELPATDAVLRIVDLSWHLFERHPFLLQPVATRPEGSDQRHQPVTDRLARLIERGQRSGEIDRELPVVWLLRATIALGHAAGEAVGAGALTAVQAAALTRTSLLRLMQAETPGLSRSGAGRAPRRRTGTRR